MITPFKSLHNWKGWNCRDQSEGGKSGGRLVRFPAWQPRCLWRRNSTAGGVIPRKIIRDDDLESWCFVWEQIKTQGMDNRDIDEADSVIVRGSTECTWRSVTRVKSSVTAVIKNHSLEGTREDTRERSSVITQNPPSVEATRLFKSEMDGENISGQHNLRY